MTLLHPYAGTEMKAKSPLIEDTMDKKVKENLEDLDTRLVAVSGGSGGAVDTGAFGEILLGAESNEGVYWKRRFSPLQNQLNQDPNNIGGFDPEGKDLKNEMLTFLESNDNGIANVVQATSYLGNGV